MKIIVLIISVVFCTVSVTSQNLVDAKGKKQGVWSKTYPGTKVFQYKGQFKDDKPTGTFTYYYVSSKIKAVITYSGNSERAFAEYYHENGQRMSKGIFSNMKKDSIWLNYAVDGKLTSSETYKNNQLDGKMVVYYLTGKDEKQPSCSFTCTYKQGVMHGEYVKYFESGALMEKGNYVGGKKEGVWEHYYPGGTKESIERYKNGIRHGWTISFDNLGKEYSKTYYFNGHKLEGKALENRLNFCKQKGINPND
jgi:antitoxin component YwqK of YwqJK toxin-antitoxin module